LLTTRLGFHASLHLLLFDNTNSTTLHEQSEIITTYLTIHTIYYENTNILCYVVQNIRSHFATRTKIMINNICWNRAQTWTTDQKQRSTCEQR